MKVLISFLKENTRQGTRGSKNKESWTLVNLKLQQVIFPHYQSRFIITGTLWLNRKIYLDKLLEGFIIQYQS